MRKFVSTWLRRIRASYWFVPSAMMLGAFVLAWVTHAIDMRVGPDLLRGFGPIQIAEPSGARAILTTIAGSVIGVAGVTFSITIATVSFASGNYGPRLIGNFMRDRGNQITLGTFIATFVYCILVLGTVREGAEDGSWEVFIPHLSLLTTLALTLSSIGMLIYFFHHVPESIDIQHLTTQIGRNLQERVEALFSRDDEEEGDAEDDDPPALPWDDRIRGLDHEIVHSFKNGYIVTVDVQGLADLAEEHDLLIDLQYRPGDFIAASDIYADVYKKDGSLLGKEISDAIRSSLTVGRQRTPDQNTLFLVDTLVEIAARALSPGVNDPQTAIACMDWLRSSAHAFGNEVQEPESPSDRLQIAPVTFSEFTGRAFSRLRPYAAADRNAGLHLITVLMEIAYRLPDDERRKRIEDELSHVVAEAKASGGDAIWVGEIEERRIIAEKALRSDDFRAALKSSPNWFGGRG
ncbi:MAG: DUF2254 domain-containing protein [Parvularcula sp.]|jgi:uncharacterized membrane protein|nr:DUF2254 domain-containing protein [Parvularcula sp.]